MLAGKGSSFGLGKYEILNHPPLMGEGRGEGEDKEDYFGNKLEY